MYMSYMCTYVYVYVYMSLNIFERISIYRCVFYVYLYVYALSIRKDRTC